MNSLSLNAQQCKQRTLASSPHWAGAAAGGPNPAVAAGRWKQRLTGGSPCMLPGIPHPAMLATASSSKKQAATCLATGHRSSGRPEHSTGSGAGGREDQGGSLPARQRNAPQFRLCLTLRSRRKRSGRGPAQWETLCWLTAHVCPALGRESRRHVWKHARNDWEQARG